MEHSVTEPGPRDSGWGGGLSLKVRVDDRSCK